MAEKFIDLKISSFKGTEYIGVQKLKYKASMNKLYSMVLDCSYSGNDEIKTGELIGESATITLSDTDGLEKKYFHGVITDLQQHNGSTNREKKLIHKDITIIIEPLFSLLGQHHNTRVFSSGNVISYVKSIVNDYHIKFRPPADCQDLIQREFCIQYNETDLNFVKRLLESEGIFYYFRHTEDGCILELGSGLSDYDSADAIKFGTDGESIAYSSIGKGDRILSGLDVISDYDFNCPKKSLESNDNKSRSKNTLNNRIVKNYTYPYPVRSFMDPKKNNDTIGNNISMRRLNSHRSQHETIELKIQGIWQGFDVGRKIKLEDKEGRFVITEYNLNITADSEGFPAIFSTITAIGMDRRFYPALETPIPHVPSQTAVVIGAEDRTIYNKTDNKGDENIFAKIKFHWDINPDHHKNSNDCSCWIRVAQAWAGPKRGFIFPPRAGDEVVVTFENGHPDMPLITGSAFNGGNILPYSLKENKNVSGIVSQSIGRGNKAGRSSAILFKDDAGKEELSLLTKGQQVNVVGKDSLRQVDGSVTEHIKKDINLTVDGDTLKKIKGKYIVEADEICFKVGSSFIHVKPDKIVLEGKEIIDNSGDKAPNEQAKALPVQQPIV